MKVSSISGHEKWVIGKKDGYQFKYYIIEGYPNIHDLFLS
jgi:hypothetical protein